MLIATVCAINKNGINIVSTWEMLLVAVDESITKTIDEMIAKGSISEKPWCRNGIKHLPPDSFKLFERNWLQERFDVCVSHGLTSKLALLHTHLRGGYGWWQVGHIWPKRAGKNYATRSEAKSERYYMFAGTEESCALWNLAIWQNGWLEPPALQQATGRKSARNIDQRKHRLPTWQCQIDTYSTQIARMLTIKILSVLISE